MQRLDLLRFSSIISGVKWNTISIESTFYNRLQRTKYAVQMLKFGQCIVFVYFSLAQLCTWNLFWFLFEIEVVRICKRQMEEYQERRALLQNKTTKEGDHVYNKHLEVRRSSYSFKSAGASVCWTYIYINTYAEIFI